MTPFEYNPFWICFYDNNYQCNRTMECENCPIYVYKQFTTIVEPDPELMKLAEELTEEVELEDNIELVETNVSNIEAVKEQGNYIGRKMQEEDFLVDMAEQKHKIEEKRILWE